ncbi:MAG: hypothetical protein JSR28_00130, partial [Proteobacteria bacterium]|nr:hypothetical protein [Pseudomonadota bacterium]
MTDLTRAEMEAILLEHEIAELEYSVDRTMATLVANPHYEIATLGVAVDGWDAIERTYDRLIKEGGKDRNIQAVARVIAEAKNTLIREAHVSFDDDEGKRVTGLYLVVMEFDPEQKKIIGERMYTDTVFGALLKGILGDDFINLPGVSSIS